MLLQVLRTYTVTVVNSDVVTVNADGSKTHCRTLRATDDCDNSSLYNQCIRVTCVPAVSKLMSGDSVASNVKSETGFDVYPVPFKDRITIRYIFDSKDRLLMTYGRSGRFL